MCPPHGYTKKNVKVFVKTMATSAETKADQRTKGSNTEDGYCRKAPLLDEIFLSTFSQCATNASCCKLPTRHERGRNAVVRIRHFLVFSK